MISSKLLIRLKQRVAPHDYDRKRFVAAAEETLAGIHEGNFARYRVRPSEFEAWRAVWK